MSIFERTELLIGKEALDRIKASTVLICGLGGVGGYVAETLARAGIGTLILIDCDIVEETNINRQIIATTQSVGQDKVSAAAQRLRLINPHINIIEKKLFLTPDNIPELISKYAIDAAADAIDNITAKVELAYQCEQNGIFIVSSMGTGNKTKPELFKSADIYKTSVCPLARVMRRLLKEKGVKKLTVVYSEEAPRKLPDGNIGTLSYVPAASALIMSKEIIENILSRGNTNV